MQHIDEAVLHEYLDRGPVNDALQAVSDHVASCDECKARLLLAESDRAAATEILRAAAPAGMPMPSFETLMPRPRFETLDAGFNTDLAAFNPGAQFKQTSIGMRGQAIAFAWAATVVLAVGLGWFASELYRAADKIAPVAANVNADSAPPSGPAVPVMTAAPAGSTTAPEASAAPTGTRGEGVVALKRVAPASDQVALNATEPRTDKPVAATTQVASTQAAEAKARAQAEPDRQVGSAPVPAAAPPALAAAPPVVLGELAVRGDRQRLVPRDAVSARTAATPASLNDTILSARMVNDTNWRPISGDSARSALGGTVVRLHSAKVIGYSESADSLPQRIRMRQVTAADDTIDIIQTRPKSPVSTNRGVPMRQPALLARVVVEGETGRKYYETLKWSDDRLVTIVAKDAATIRRLKDQLEAERE